MVIYFEGISCAGKSTIIEALKAKLEGSVSISELPDDYKKHKNLDDFCRYNDERKSQTALKMAKTNKTVLVDRGYASTMVYNYIQYQQGLSSEYLKSLNWYIKNIDKKLQKPDLYVYIKIKDKTAIKRAKKLNRFSKTIAWYNNPQIGSGFYESFFKMFEPDVPLIEIDGDLPLDVGVRAVLKYLKNNEKNKQPR